MRPQAKYAVIYYHRKEYAATVSKFFEVSRSGHHRFVGRLGRSEKDAALAEKIFQQHNKCIRIYGYCRMWQSLKSSAGFYHNSKIILRVMKQYDLLSEIHRRKNWQQMGDNCTNTITSLSFQILLPSCGAGRFHPRRHTDTARLAEDGCANPQCGHMLSSSAH